MKKSNLYQSPASSAHSRDGLISTVVATTGLSTRSNTADEMEKVRPVLSGLHLFPDFEHYPRRKDWAGMHLSPLIEECVDQSTAEFDDEEEAVALMSMRELMDSFIDLVGDSVISAGLHSISVARSLTFNDFPEAGKNKEDQLFPASSIVVSPIISPLERKYFWGSDLCPDIQNNRIAHVWTTLYTAAVIGSNMQINHALRLLHTPPEIAAVYVALSVTRGQLHTFDALSDPWNFVLSDHVTTYIVLALLTCGWEDALFLLSDVESGLFTSSMANSRPELVMDGFVDQANALLDIDPHYF